MGCRDACARRRGAAVREASVRLVLTRKHGGDAIDIGEHLRCGCDPGPRQRHRHPNLIAFEVMRVRDELGELPFPLPADV